MLPPLPILIQIDRHHPDRMLVKLEAVVKRLRHHRGCFLAKA